MPLWWMKWTIHLRLSSSVTEQEKKTSNKQLLYWIILSNFYNIHINKPCLRSHYGLIMKESNKNQVIRFRQCPTKWHSSALARSSSSKSGISLMERLDSVVLIRKSFLGYTWVTINSRNLEAWGRMTTISVVTIHKIIVGVDTVTLNNDHWKMPIRHKRGCGRHPYI